jgi:glycosyltransferase involved in cell wall biosynthesis
VKRLRVAFVTPTLHPGGAERQMLLLATAMPRDAVDVRFIVLAERGPLAAEAEALGIRVQALGLSRERCRRPGPRCAASVLAAVARYVRATRDLDVVDAWLVPALTLVGLAQPLARVPVLVGGRRSLAAVARPRSRPRRWAAVAAMRAFDAWVANSAAAAGDMVAVDGMDISRVHVIPNAVASGLTGAAEAQARGFARASLQAGEDDLLVGCVANLLPGKGLLRLVDVIGRLHRRHPSLRLVLVGEGPLRADLERSIAAHELRGIVRLHGSVPDARLLYPAFDLAVQASESEGLPNAVLEAAAAGRAIVATAVGGTAEVVEDGRSAVLVPAADEKALAAAIESLATDPGKRERLGAEARARAAAFSPERLAESTLALYRSLVGRGAA